MSQKNANAGVSTATAQNNGHDPIVNNKKQPVNLTTHQIRVLTVNRTKKSIEQWRQHHWRADSRTIPNRARLYELYDDILLDGHLTGIIQKRQDSVLNKVISYVGKSGKKIEGMESLIKSIPFREMCKEILNTINWGITAFEFIPGEDFDFELIDRRHVKPHWRVISSDMNAETGIPYDDYPNIWVIGQPRELGLLLKAAPYAIYKRDNYADWSNFIEIFGIPMRVIEYDANDEQIKAELKQILEESGSATAILIPKQANFKPIDGKTSNANGELQEKMKDAMNAEMSICILGNTDTTSAGKHGSNAKSQTHQEQQNEIQLADIFYLEAYLNSKEFAAILRSYGLPIEEGGRFQIAKNIDVEKVKTLIAIALSLKEAGVPIDDQYFYDTAGIPKPDNYDELKSQIEAKFRSEVSEKQEPNKRNVGAEPKPKSRSESGDSERQSRNLSDITDLQFEDMPYNPYRKPPKTFKSILKDLFAFFQ